MAGSPRRVAVAETPLDDVTRKMHASPLTALSPLDGRYAGKLDALRPLALGIRPDALPGPGRGRVVHRPRRGRLAELAPPGAGGARVPAPAWSRDFSVADAEAIKAIEQRTNHDVKAVEYWLGERFAAEPALAGATGFIHFACTSEDINNTSHALMLERGAARGAAAGDRRASSRALARAGRASTPTQPMLARTHGQTASADDARQGDRQRRRRAWHAARARIAAVALLAKMNGAVGNYNAHVAAYPELDWEALARRVVEERLGLAFNPLHDPDRAARRASPSCSTRSSAATRS